MASSIWQRKGNATCTTLTQRPRYKTWCWRHPFNPCLFSVGTTQYQFTFYNGDPGAVWLGYSDVSQGSWYWWFYNLWSLLYISIIYDTLGAFKNKALVQEYCFMQREERFSNATASPVLLRYKHPIMNYSFYVDSEYKTMPLHHLNLIKPGSLIEKELPKKAHERLLPMHWWDRSKIRELGIWPGWKKYWSKWLLACHPWEWALGLIGPALV